MVTISALSHFAHQYAFLAYVLIFIGMILEGELVMIFAGILAQLGALSFPLVLVVAFVGAFAKTLSWYRLGDYIGRKYGENKFLKYLEKRVFYLFPRLRERSFWSIFISKYIYGINHFTLILAGYLKLNFKTYLKAEITSSIIWVLGLVSLGYYFSHAALSYSKELNHFSLIILLFILGFVFIEKFIAFIIELTEDAKQK